MKRRTIQKVPNIKDENLVELILSMSKHKRTTQLQAYAAFVYLFGNRVSEGLGLPQTEEIGEPYKYIRTSKKGSREVLIPRKRIVPDKWAVEPLRAWQVELDKEAGVLWVRGVPTFKTSNRPLRDVWVLIDGSNERPLVQLLWRYVQKKRLEAEDAVLFSMSRQAAYNGFRKYLGINAFPHKLRDLRATKDATVYGLDAKDLQEKFNWARPEMAMYYGRKNRIDIIAKMRKNSS